MIKDAVQRMVLELQVNDLYAGIEGKEIIRGLSLKVRQGEIHALMGPNGSGKSTLSYAIMGHPKYRVFGGDVLLNGESILGLLPNERSSKGLFLGFQYPVEVPGVGLANFLRTAYNDLRKGTSEGGMSVMEFQDLMREKLGLLEMDQSFANRYLNEGFSGGEKKRSEVLQMAVLRPKIAFLDEPDSGLDIDALKTVAATIKRVSGPEIGIVIVTHYQRILKYIEPDFVHVLIDGRIVRSGGRELAEVLEEKGYEWLRDEAKAA